VFTVIGFGLIFSYFRTATLSGIFISLIIVSLTILISPIFQKFWFNVFIYGFNGPAIAGFTADSNVTLFTS
jgi:hypothetical protein